MHWSNMTDPLKVFIESDRIRDALAHLKTDADAYKITDMKKTGNNSWPCGQVVCATWYQVMNFFFTFLFKKIALY